MPQEGKLLGYTAGEEVEWDLPFWQQVIIKIIKGEASCLIPLWAWQAGGALTGTENLSRTDKPPLVARWFSCELQLQLKGKIPMIWRRAEDTHVSDRSPKKAQKPQARKTTWLLIILHMSVCSLSCLSKACSELAPLKHTSPVASTTTGPWRDALYSVTPCYFVGREGQKPVLELMGCVG